jgi:hypothetical protein
MTATRKDQHHLKSTLAQKGLSTHDNAGDEPVEDRNGRRLSKIVAQNSRVCRSIT